MPRKTETPALIPAPAADNNLPIHQIRHRSIKAAIWKNQTAKGAMYDVRITRSYKVGDEWHDTNSFGYDDLLVVAKLMYDAHSYVSALRAKDHGTGRSGKQRERATPQAS